MLGETIASSRSLKKVKFHPQQEKKRKERMQIFIYLLVVLYVRIMIYFHNILVLKYYLFLIYLSHTHSIRTLTFFVEYNWPDKLLIRARTTSLSKCNSEMRIKIAACVPQVCLWPLHQKLFFCNSSARSITFLIQHPDLQAHSHVFSYTNDGLIIWDWLD